MSPAGTAHDMMHAGAPGSGAAGERSASAAARRRSHGAPLRRSRALRQGVRRPGPRRLADARSRVIDALALRPGQIVADIGAGTGYFSTRLAKARGQADRLRRGHRAVDGRLPHQAGGRARASANLHAVQAIGGQPEPARAGRRGAGRRHLPSHRQSRRLLRRRAQAACGRAAGSRSSTSARTRPATARRPTSGSRRSRFPPTWPRPASCSTPSYDFLPRQHFLVYRSK